MTEALVFVAILVSATAGFIFGLAAAWGPKDKDDVTFTPDGNWH